MTGYVASHVLDEGTYPSLAVLVREFRHFLLDSPPQYDPYYSGPGMAAHGAGAGDGNFENTSRIQQYRS